MSLGSYQMSTNSYSQTVVNVPSVKPLKQGWILKRSSGFLPRWKPKYLILYPEPTVLLLFDQCDQLHPAKYQIDVTPELELRDDLNHSNFAFFGARKRLFGFTLGSKYKKVNVDQKLILVSIRSQHAFRP